jgi:putative hemolysin
LSSVHFDLTTQVDPHAPQARWSLNASPCGPEDAILGQIGSLQVRLARNEADVAAAQALRFRVFVREMGALASRSAHAEELDSDEFDPICDHLLVIDTGVEGGVADRIVGTYRLLTQERASGRFYSDSEFELGELVARHPTRRFLELGRSCVLPAYRSKRTIELLWQGIWTYCRRNEIDVMVGCASFGGTVPSMHAQALSFLAHNFQAYEDWHVRARSHRYSSMDLMPCEAINPKVALAATPPLVKGYLRLGARFGEGCVIDHEFDTTDVLVVLPVENIPSRYLAYYGSDAEVGG